MGERAVCVPNHDTGGFKSGRTCFRDKYSFFLENSRINRRKDLYFFPSQKMVLVRHRNVLIRLGTFCFDVSDYMFSNTSCHGTNCSNVTHRLLTAYNRKTELMQIILDYFGSSFAYNEEKKSIFEKEKIKLCAN